MAFQIKDFVSITASMLNHIRGTTTKITDLIPGSVARTLVEAPAVEIEELYLQYFNGLREAIPVATFKSFGFGKLAAAYARGYVSVSHATPPDAVLTVPTNTPFTSSDGRVYYSTQDVSWLTDQTSVRIPVIAAASGLSYNIAAASITSSTFFNSEYTVSNSAITNGRDVETDSEREARFAAYVSALSRGTEVACIYGATTATVTDEAGNIQEYVTRTGYSEIAGYFKIFIYSSNGIPSDELVTNAQRILDGRKDADTGVITPGYRAGGVRGDIVAMSQRAVPLTARVAMLDTYSLDASVVQNMTDAFATELLSVGSGEVIYADQIETALLSVTGVKSVVIDITANIVCGVSEALVPGVISVTAL